MQGNPFSRLAQGGGHHAHHIRPASELKLHGDGDQTDRTGSNGSDDDSCEDGDVRDWISSAGTGELDFYTVFGLSNGKDHFGKRTRAYVGSLLTMLFLQGLVPWLLVVYFMGHHEPVIMHKSWEIRVIGAGLFAYAIHGMYGAAMDDCRVGLIGLATKYEIDKWILIPLFLGEFTNTLTGAISTTSLFFIFTISASPIDLILNSLAINYLVAIDNEFTTDDMRSSAMNDFRDIIAEGQTDASHARNSAIVCLQWFLYIVRIVFIVIFGAVYTVVYLFNLEHVLCEHLPGVVIGALPFCDVAVD
eukprot:TRINITY_DN7047_c1_g2_i1.p1 TRINITY_DN7047_c1_g2~~TRINITY_DN7047_c1_g2_i1.p1  ORF type:complete len:327 (-),score=53.63 TRINITY_DN7047_c1_g2_i1:55-963(-)